MLNLTAMWSSRHLPGYCQNEQQVWLRKFRKLSTQCGTQRRVYELHLGPSRKCNHWLTTVFSFKSLYFFSGSPYIFEESALISFQATSIYKLYIQLCGVLWVPQFVWTSLFDQPVGSGCTLNCWPWATGLGGGDSHQAGEGEFPTRWGRPRQISKLEGGCGYSKE